MLMLGHQGDQLGDAHVLPDIAISGGVQRLAAAVQGQHTSCLGSCCRGGSQH